MPPKKKGNKKAQDDWEADLGESIPPQGAAAESPNPDEPTAEDGSIGGGLMASLQRRSKKKNKKNADEDWVQGEDPPADGQSQDLASKAPEEGNFDDDDVFAGNAHKKKGKAAEKAADEPIATSANDGARVKTKAEKEKEKKEKEKQRKKELVGIPASQVLQQGRLTIVL